MVEIGAFVPLLPLIAVTLAEGDEPGLQERALALYVFATGQPLVAKGQLFEDVAGRRITAATATLPAAGGHAARERGRALDWWETARELLAELEAKM